MGNTKKCIIIAGGKLNSPEIIKKEIEKIEFSKVFACDSGYDKAKILGLQVDTLVGDLDSTECTAFDALEIIKLIPEKDDTDLKVCVDLAISEGFLEIYIFCATGGRADHFLNNLSILQHMKNAKGFIIDEENHITFVKKGVFSYENTHKYVSIIPVSKSIVLSLKNMKYPLENGEIFRDNIISVSNEATEDTFEIDLKKGKAYVIKAN